MGDVILDPSLRMMTLSAFGAVPSVTAFCLYISLFSLPLVTVAGRVPTKPVIAIAPAAWHSPIHYALYVEKLHIAGYRTVSERLPSCDSPNPMAQSVSGDAAFIVQNLLMPSINAGKEVVLVTHSYSGGPGAVAAKGLSVVERRAAGKTGGIIGLIYICAFVAEEGQSLLSSSGGQYAPWVIEYVGNL